MMQPDIRRNCNRFTSLDGGFDITCRSSIRQRGNSTQRWFQKNITESELSLYPPGRVFAPPPLTSGFKAKRVLARHRLIYVQEHMGERWVIGIHPRS